MLNFWLENARACLFSHPKLPVLEITRTLLALELVSMMVFQIPYLKVQVCSGIRSNKFDADWKFFFAYHLYPMYSSIYMNIENYVVTIIYSGVISTWSQHNELILCIFQTLVLIHLLIHFHRTKTDLNIRQCSMFTVFMKFYKVCA